MFQKKKRNSKKIWPYNKPIDMFARWGKTSKIRSLMFVNKLLNLPLPEKTLSNITIFWLDEKKHGGCKKNTSFSSLWNCDRTFLQESKTEKLRSIRDKHGENMRTSAEKNAEECGDAKFSPTPAWHEISIRHRPHTVLPPITLRGNGNFPWGRGRIFKTLWMSDPGLI